MADWLRRLCSRLGSMALIGFFFLPLALVAILANLPFDPYKDKSVLRNHIPPLFHPMREDFTCRHEADVLPPIDAQADAWLQEALALENRDIPRAERDYKRIIELTQAAAERKHWQAMLNLVNLRLEKRGASWGLLPYSQEQAVREVEAAMALGIPAAFDKMGYFYEHSIGVEADISAAYAFYQMAAEMGHPPAMTFLADKMTLVSPDPDQPNRWANVPVATEMLECAFSQGYGPAAYELHFLQKRPATPEANARALKTLHEGVKMGNRNCASSLDIQFSGRLWFGTENDLVGTIDTIRAERYQVLARHLDWYGPRVKFPNLDKVVPLPPAELPVWDGKRESLVEAAKAVVVLPAPPPPHPGTRKTGRAHVPEGHTLRSEPISSTAGYMARAFYAGYYQPAMPIAGDWHFVNRIEPQRYERSEMLASFAALHPQHPVPEIYHTPWHGLKPAERAALVWNYLGEAVPLAVPETPQRVRHRLAREIARPRQIERCMGDQPCPSAGIWHAQLDPGHALAKVFNGWARQAYVAQGDAFPTPGAWHLAIEAKAVHWDRLEAGSERNASGIEMARRG